MNETTCKGSYALGTACGNCAKCQAEANKLIPQYRAEIASLHKELESDEAMGKVVHNPANYRELLIPFQNGNEADKAVERFFGLAMKARNACHLPDVHLLIKFQVIVDGSERTAMISGHLGNTAEGLNMCAWGVKKEMHDQQVTINKIFVETTENEPQP